jgi:putative transport protein
MREAIASFLAQYPIVTLFAVIGIGYLLGEVRILGFRLGVAGVLFAGLAAGTLGPDIALPSIVSTFGLILFIYTIGIQFGPAFVNPFRGAGSRHTLFCVAMAGIGRRHRDGLSGMDGSAGSDAGRSVFGRPDQRPGAGGGAGGAA